MRQFTMQSFAPKLALISSKVHFRILILNYSSKGLLKNCSIIRLSKIVLIGDVLLIFDSCEFILFVTCEK